MEQRQIPGSEIRISKLAIGGWLTFGGSVDDDLSLRILHRAVDAGVTFIDLADVYGRGAAETVVGKFLAEKGRDNLVISSKVFWPMSDDPGDRGLGREHILRSVDRSLQRLGIDHLDLYFCHREDPNTPLAETMEAMHDLQRAGKIRAWGTSVWSTRTLRRASELAGQHGWAPPIVEQPSYNLLERWIEVDVVPETGRLGMGIVVWSPMAGGYLSGKYLQGVPAGSRAAETDFLREYLRPANIGKLRRFCAIAAEMGASPASLALAWAADQPGITSAIMGATSLEQLEENLLAAELQIPAEVSADLDRLFPPQRQGRAKRMLRRLLGRA